MICTSCGRTIDTSAQFCSACGRPLTMYAAPPVTERLFRPREGRMIAGVCAGFAVRYGWDVALVRLVLLLAVVFGGTGVLAYLIAWIVMPNGQYLLPGQVGVPMTPTAGVPQPVQATSQTGTGPGSMTV